MIVLHYYDKKMEVLNTLSKNPPTIGTEVVIKGRKGIVIDTRETSPGHLHVIVELEIMKKASKNLLLDDKKKRKR